MAGERPIDGGCQSSITNCHTIQLGLWCNPVDASYGRAQMHNARWADRTPAIGVSERNGRRQIEWQLTVGLLHFISKLLSQLPTETWGPRPKRILLLTFISPLSLITVITAPYSFLLFLFHYNCIIAFNFCNLHWSFKRYFSFSSVRWRMNEIYIDFFLCYSYGQRAGSFSADWKLSDC